MFVSHGTYYAIFEYDGRGRGWGVLNLAWIRIDDAQVAHSLRSVDDELLLVLPDDLELLHPELCVKEVEEAAYVTEHFL